MASHELGMLSFVVVRLIWSVMFGFGGVALIGSV